MLNGEMTKIIYDPLDIVTFIDGKLMALAIADTKGFLCANRRTDGVKLGPPPDNTIEPQLKPW